MENEKLGQQELRKVVIGTPSLNGSVSSWYLDSIVTSVKLCLVNGIELFPITLVNESILPMARNELLKIAYEGGAESLIFVDSDQAWDPFALLGVLNSGYDVLGLPVVSKTDEPGQFNVRLENLSELEFDNDENLKVQAVGTGFLKLSRNVLEKLWQSCEEVEFRGKKLKKICEYATAGTSFIGEDIELCRKIRDLGFDIWVDTRSTCFHVGNKVWGGDFRSFIASVKNLGNS